MRRHLSGTYLRSINTSFPSQWVSPAGTGGAWHATQLTSKARSRGEQQRCRRLRVDGILGISIARSEHNEEYSTASSTQIPAFPNCKRGEWEGGGAGEEEEFPAPSLFSNGRSQDAEAGRKFPWVRKTRPDHQPVPPSSIFGA